MALDNRQFDLDASDSRSAIFCLESEDIELSGFKADDAHGAALITLRGVRDAFIHGCRPLTQTGAFVRLEGANCSAIVLWGNELAKAAESVEYADGASDGILMENNTKRGPGSKR